GTRVFRRGLSIVRDEMVLVVDDILTTGGSVREVINAARQAGGNVLGAGVLIDRSDGDLDLRTPLFSCYRLAIPTYPPDQCPECKKGVPLSRPGGGL
ncbi:MAG: orotate phosphoribosyltransferase, partial [Chloroflexi bacterium]|nr:orotate phosphoribosyltransferase [Chloroflexota bacterium]